MEIANACPAFRAELMRDPDVGARVTVGDVAVRTGALAGNATVAGVTLSLAAVSAREAFDRLVRRPWEAVPTAELPVARVVLVDALDESLSWPGAETVASPGGEYRRGAAPVACVWSSPHAPC